LTRREDKGGMPAIRTLLNPDCFPHPAESIELIETHISWVLLAGAFAYKLKKPVDLGFLDFSTLERRAHYCAEELRINRRLARSLYLDVVALCREGDRYHFGGDGEPVEYAVRMRRFRQDQQLDRCLERGELGDNEIDEIATLIGAFHEAAPKAPPESDWGTPATVLRPFRENFSQLSPVLQAGRRADDIARLHAWSETMFPLLTPKFALRREQGRVRECHGDLHLRNMARVDGKIVAFDGIEFDPALRWIDVISDSAFLMMDLQSRGQPGLAWRFLNGWLQSTGDFDGLGLLRWYLVYRHMVRAKVDAIRLNQEDVKSGEATRLEKRMGSHLSLALREIKDPAPALLIACGVSGSGKSWLAERLAQRLPAVWIRSDVERKRLFGMAPTQRPAEDRIPEVYGVKATRRTYDRLAEVADGALGAGYTIIADATYLDRHDRDILAQVAEHHHAPAIILACDAPSRVLRERVARRQQDNRDASDAGLRVLESQLRERRSFGETEPVLSIVTDETLDVEQLVTRIRKRMGATRS